jgi:serine/threonine protein kinase
MDGLSPQSPQITCFPCLSWFVGKDHPELAGRSIRQVPPQSIVAERRDQFIASMGAFHQEQARQKAPWKDVPTPPLSSSRVTLDNNKMMPDEGLRAKAPTISSLDLEGQPEPLIYGEVEEVTMPIAHFLEQKGIVLDEFIGQGAHGGVMSIKVDDSKNSYILKYALQTSLATAEKMHREGPFAASLLSMKRDPATGASKLPNFAKMYASIVDVTPLSSDGHPIGPRKLAYVPLSKAKEFSRGLSPSTIQTVVQIMEKAEGENLEILLTKTESEGGIRDNSYHYFPSFAKQMVEFLEAAADRNFIHLDLKPPNIICQVVNQERGELKVTVIDADLGDMYAKPEKRDIPAWNSEKGPVTPKSQNLLLSTKSYESYPYHHSKIPSGQFYGQEVDFFSFALSSMEFLEPGSMRIIRRSENPEAVCQRVLEKIKSKNSSYADYIRTCVKIANMDPRQWNAPGGIKQSIQILKEATHPRA